MLTFPLRLALVMLLYGALFKVMHWPFANQLMLIGNVSILVLYTIRFFYKTDKISLDYVKLGLVITWVLGYLIKIYHLFNIAYLFEVIVLGLFMRWFIEEGIVYFTRRELINNGFIKFFYYGFSATSVALIIIGMLFKIQHWPYGSIIFTFGCLILSIMLIVDYFVIKKV